jgi:hypothetical protein
MHPHRLDRARRCILAEQRDRRSALIGSFGCIKSMAGSARSTQATQLERQATSRDLGPPPVL